MAVERKGTTPAAGKVTVRKGSTNRGTAPPRKTTPTAGRPGGRPPVKKKPGKSIVNQRQTPWGLIAITTAIVLFAAAIVVAVVVTRKSTPEANGGCSKMIGNNKQSFLNENQCAADIQGVTFTPIADRNHVTTTVKYQTTPPDGGNHSPYWADCSGTVYPQPIANENAVHTLEHGAIWITYKQGLDTADVATLSALVNGHNYMIMSPYPAADMTSNISLQAWGYQLKVDSASDPRIAKFITALNHNRKTTPEYGAVCTQPTFKAHPSTFGNPLSAPVK
jgi:hypothetical protein